MFKKFLIHTKVFGLRYAVLEALALIDLKLCNQMHVRPNKRLRSLRETFVHDWLSSFLAPLIESYQKRPARESTVSPAQSCYVWVCWLQGLASAPDRIKRLVDRISKMSSGRTVVILDEAAIRDYCDLPDIIWEKYANGVITQQQFTDIVRCALLASRGGLWVDSTLLVTSSIPDCVFSNDTWCIKGLNPESEGSGFVPYFSEWQSYFVASQPSSVTYQFLYESLVYYWKRMNTNIDYFLLFYLSKIAREMIPAASEEYAKIPENNVNCEMLAPRFYDSTPVTEEDVRSFFENSGTYVYKLSWRAKYAVGGRGPSYYDRVRELYL